MRLAIVGHGLLARSDLAGGDALGERVVGDGESTAISGSRTSRGTTASDHPLSNLGHEAARQSVSVMHTQTAGICTALFE
jgi:hypothetical protein